MNLIGSKCRLTTVNANDALTISIWENNPEHWLVSNTVAPYTIEEIKDFIAKSNNLFVNLQTRMMVWSLDGERVGCIDLYDYDPKNRRVGVGVLIDPGFRQKGFALDALTTLLDYCFDEVEVHSVFADVPSNNAGSIRLFESAGFERMGLKKDWLRSLNSYIDVYFYQLIRNS